jgi:SP family general alpha glucoside:H+ symporter-like MFS transporter
MSNKDNEGSTAHDEKKDDGGPDEVYSQQTLGEAGVWTATVAEAQAANAHEHSLTVRQALRAYPWAVFWSFAVSMSIIMEGYDTILVGSLYAYPTFAQKFGTFTPATNNYQIPAAWQSAMGSGPQAGAFIGALANGFFIQRFGYKPAFLIGLVLMISFIFISFFGMTIQLQAAAQILCGYVLCCLRYLTSGNESSANMAFQCSMGNICNHRLCIRLRIVSSCSSTLFDIVCQSMLCSRPVYRRWCPSEFAHSK